jgi:hypothetical protein
MTDIDLQKLATLRKDMPDVPVVLDVVEMDLLPVGDLAVDRRYQRKVSQGSLARIRKIIRDFSWARFGAVIVARAEDDSCYYLIDGQHRAIAARAMGIDLVPAVIVSGDVATQAGDFVGINATRTSVASIDKFRARVTSGDSVAVQVADMLHQLEVSTDIAAGASLRPRQTRAVSQLEKLIRRIGRGETYTTLEMMLDAQPEEPNLLTAFAIEATAMTVHQVIGAEGDLDRLQKVIEVTDYEDLKDRAAAMVKAKHGGKQAVEGHNLLGQAYNKRLRNTVA